MRSSLRFWAPRSSALTGLDTFGWIALGALVLGSGAAAMLLAPWKLKFAMDARELYTQLYRRARSRQRQPRLARRGRLWLSGDTAGERRKVRLMSGLSGVLGTLMIVQTLAWLAALAVE